MTSAASRGPVCGGSGQGGVPVVVDGVGREIALVVKATPRPSPGASAIFGAWRRGQALLTRRSTGRSSASPRRSRTWAGLSFSASASVGMGAP